MIQRLGPHDLTGLANADVRRWAQKSRITKSVGNTAAIQAGGVLKVYRWPFSEVEQTDILNLLDVNNLVGSILNGLAGFRAENLYVELLNEVGKGRRDQYVALAKLAIPKLHAQGLKVAGPSWATGDYEQEDWDAFKGIGFDAIALHAYWSTAGFTQWNAYRWETYWRPGDPPVLVTETGRDRVRDGNPNVNDGWLPTDNSGSYGWQAASQQCPADQYLDELVRYDALLQGSRSAIGAVVFTSSPTQDWRDKGFSTDDIAGRIADLTAPEAVLWAPPHEGNIDPVPVSRPTGNSEPSRANGGAKVAFHGGPRAKTLGAVIHSTRSGKSWSAAEELAATVRYFKESGEASAHVVIGPTSAVEVVPIELEAWHGRDPLNQTHIGYELTQALPTQPYTPFQYQELARRITVDAARFGFPLSAVVGHEDTENGKADGKTDPGGQFDWNRLRALLSPADGIVALQDRTWAIAEDWRKAGYAWTEQGIKALVALGKGEK